MGGGALHLFCTGMAVPLRIARILAATVRREDRARRGDSFPCQHPFSVAVGNWRYCLARRGGLVAESGPDQD